MKVYYEKKKALFIYGTFGIGKSQLTREVAKEIAESKSKKFVEWNNLQKKEKQEVMSYPEKFFVLIDERLSEYDSSDIKGLPDFRDGQETIMWKIPEWSKYITLPNSDGIVFFDEINLATPLVISSVYKIIYDRIISDNRISDNWLIMGAGNLESDRAFTHTLPAPVRDRGGEVELVPPNVDDWTEWAGKHDIDGRIIGFVNFKQSYLQVIKHDDNQKYTTVRGWERLSDLIADIKNNDILELVACSCIGEGIASEFVSFCRIQDKMNLEEFIKNPKKIETIDKIDIKYFLVTSVAERYKTKKVDFNKIMDISKVLDKIGNAEFVALLWKLSYNYDNQRFRQDFVKSKDTKLIEKYSKYIV